jgi:hypothetical protein
MKKSIKPTNTEKSEFIKALEDAYKNHVAGEEIVTITSDMSKAEKEKAYAKIFAK